MDDAYWPHYDDEPLRLLQQLLLPMTNPFGQYMHFRFLVAIRSLRVSCFPIVIQERLDCCVTPGAFAIDAVGPVSAIVPVLTVPIARSFGVDCDEREIQETNFDGNVMVVDSDVECLSELHEEKNTIKSIRYDFFAFNFCC